LQASIIINFELGEVKKRNLLSHYHKKKFTENIIELTNIEKSNLFFKQDFLKNIL